jgi:hypothetical protein
MRASQLYRTVIWTVFFCGAMIVSSAQSTFDPLNSVANIARVQENLLAGMIARTRESEENGEMNEVVEAFQRAVAAEDALNYTEPPSWFPPVCPLLGQVLLKAGRATEAERFFATISIGTLVMAARFPVCAIV